MMLGWLLAATVAFSPDTQDNTDDASGATDPAPLALPDSGSSSDPMLTHDLPPQPRHMVQGAALVNFGIGELESGAQEGLTASIGILSGYAFTLHRYVQAYAAMTVDHVNREGNADETRLTARTGGIANYSVDGDLRRAWTFTHAIGLEHQEVGGSKDTAFLWSLLVGKRIQLTDTIVYSPALGVEGIKSDSRERVTFMIYPLQFDFFVGEDTANIRF